MRISDWSSDVCSSDLDDRHHLWLLRRGAGHGEEAPPQEEAALQAQGRPEAGRARLGQLSRSSASSLSWPGTITSGPGSVLAAVPAKLATSGPGAPSAAAPRTRAAMSSRSFRNSVPALE